MAETIGILFRFSKDTDENLQIVKQNYLYVKKCVRKMVKKFNIFVPTDVTRSITLSHVDGDRQYQLRIAHNSDLIYTTDDSSFKNDWTEMRFVTVYVEPLLPDIKIQSSEKKLSEGCESLKAAEKLDDISSRLDKLETLFRAAIIRIGSGAPKPQQNSAKPTPEKKTGVQPPTAPSNLASTPLKSTKVVVNNQRQVSPAQTKSVPAKIVNNVGSAVPQMTPPQTSVNAKVPQSMQVKQLTALAPTAASASKVKKAANSNPARRFPLPYNVSQPNNPKPVNSTPLNATNSAALLGSPVKQFWIPKSHPQPFDNAGGDDESGRVIGTAGNLKRPLEVIETNGTPPAKRKPRPEKPTDPEALVHLEEIIDAVAVGLEDPDDFTIEPPFTQTLFETSISDPISTVMEFEQFVETLPKKKKSKKHRQSNPDMLGLVQ